jgi:hypothetical protein
VDKPYGRGLALTGWWLAALGIVLILASTVSAEHLTIPLQVAGFLLFATGSAGFVVGQIRS